MVENPPYDGASERSVGPFPTAKQAANALLIKEGA
jgi:hypothetical protein